MFKTIGLFDAVKSGAGTWRRRGVFVQATSAALAAKDGNDLVGIDGEVNVRTPITLRRARRSFKRSCEGCVRSVETA